jgi:hypothetical protein
MRTISNSEFAAHPEMYLDMAREQDVRVKKGRDTFRLVYETPDRRSAKHSDEQPLLAPDDDLRSAITGEELLAGIYSDLETFFAGHR